MYILMRDKKEFDKVTLDPTLPTFTDTETCIHLGYTMPKGQSHGGLYGRVRLVQITQPGWDLALLIDTFFIPLQDVLALLKSQWLVFHNSSYDLHTINLHTKETWLPARLDDTLYLSRLTYFDKQKFNFYECLKYAKEYKGPAKELDKKTNQIADWSKPLSDDMKKYAACDVLYLEKLWNHVHHKTNLEAYQLDIANTKHAIHYNRNGIPICRDTVKEMQLEYMNKSEELLRELPVNPNSPKQCCEWLGSASSDATTLGTMALEGDSRAQLLIDARHYTKGLSFLAKYDRDVMKGFHNACGTITGRMSCSGGDRIDHENLQQPPKYIFKCFVAPDGKIIIYMDYAALELRMAVAYTGEPTMAQMMFDGVDLHTHTGCYLFNETPETLPKIKRTITKFYNFGTAYGAQGPTLRALLRSQGRIDLPLKEVIALRSKWLEMYPYFEAWHSVHKRHLAVHGYLDTTTPLGRTVRAFTLPDSLNFPIQGGASEVTKKAIDLLVTRFPEVYIINVVHDSVALVQDIAEAEMWIERLNDAMVDAWYYVIKDLEIPDLPMPREAEASKLWNF